ncbi:fungal-specific transcription factor domain-containing protein [Ampelomyces quisqualis]|uniref:Fungal-specific transcription factor domain-containing protein n=1 Tax=Ampelomyces quisqualis TaxID=50730 RepID=A0A6A5R3J5_AMPQU|nr:fungal-specific transcription factor domain-containing protein [Ampelomyces quisqualis]
MTMKAETPSYHEVSSSRRRPKPTLSCTLCRRRKLKCDRQQPCKTCVDRGLSLSCTFARSVPVPQQTRGTDSVHDRITQLEQLVTSLMGSKETEHPSLALPSASPLDRLDEEDQPEVPDTPDRVKFSNDTTTYTNSSHWTSILDGISELKEHLDHIPTSAHAQDNNVGDIPGPDLLFGRQRHATKQELLAALPLRSEADQLVASFFVSMNTAPTLIHRPSFLRQYERFWTRPFETPTMWIGLLYSVFCIGARFQASGPDGQGSEGDPLYTARVDYYREKVAQALILANYTKCPPYTMETFLTYFGSEYTRSSDTQFGMWILVGMIVRIALRMGYHREPSRFANIPPFEAELRRRAWLVVLSLDLVSSSQVGLPRMIQPFMYDTQEPRNVDEEDLYEDMVELPPSKPELELTPLLYSIVMTRVRTVHAKIMDLTNATSQPPYRDVMNMDTVLRHVYDKLPESSRAIAAMDFDIAEDPTAMRRVYLGLSFLKAELMLHRAYHLHGRTDTRYEYSRRVCLNAAYEMLELQQKLDAEIQPGGKLWSPGWQVFTMSWYMSAIVAQDFLLATTVLISDLDEDLTSPCTTVYEGATSGLKLDRGPPSRQQITELLREAQQIWYKASKRSNEAQKAAEAIRLVLNKADIDAQQTADPFESNMPHAQADLAGFTGGPSSQDFFGMDMYPPFAANDFSMNLGGFTDTFNWGSLAADASIFPYDQKAHQPPASSQPPCQ